MPDLKQYAPPVVIGTLELVPYLGLTQYQPFVQLWGMYPESVREFAIWGSVVASVVTCVTAKQAGGKLEVARIGQRLAAAVALISLVLLVALTFGLSERVDDDLRIAKSWSRQPNCPCCEQMSDADCLARITVASEAVERCWGDRQLAVVQTSFTVGYLLLAGALGYWFGANMRIGSLSKA